MSQNVTGTACAGGYKWSWSWLRVPMLWTSWLYLNMSRKWFGSFLLISTLDHHLVHVMDWCLLGDKPTGIEKDLLAPLSILYVCSRNGLTTMFERPLSWQMKTNRVCKSTSQFHYITYLLVHTIWDKIKQYRPPTPNQLNLGIFLSGIGIGSPHSQRIQHKLST